MSGRTSFIGARATRWRPPHVPFPHLGLHRRVAVLVSGILLGVFLAFGYIGWEAVSRRASRPQTSGDQGFRARSGFVERRAVGGGWD